MEYSTALGQLASWLLSSQGQPITLPNGSICGFHQTHRFDDKQLTGLEQQYGITLPIAYRKLLRHVGASVLFAKAGGGNKSGIEFSRVDNTFQVFAMRSKEPLTAVFSDCIPIGRDNDHGKVLAVTEADGSAILVTAEKVVDNWDHFDLETPEHRPFKDWVASLVESKISLRS